MMMWVSSTITIRGPFQALRGGSYLHKKVNG
jgi:hypothetical protein